MSFLKFIFSFLVAFNIILTIGLQIPVSAQVNESTNTNLGLEFCNPDAPMNKDKEPIDVVNNCVRNLIIFLVVVAIIVAIVKIIIDGMETMSDESKSGNAIITLRNAVIGVILIAAPITIIATFNSANLDISGLRSLSGLSVFISEEEQAKKEEDERKEKVIEEQAREIRLDAFDKSADDLIADNKSLVDNCKNQDDKKQCKADIQYRKEALQTYVNLCDDKKIGLQEIIDAYNNNFGVDRCRNISTALKDLSERYDTMVKESGAENLGFLFGDVKFNFKGGINSIKKVHHYQYEMIVVDADSDPANPKTKFCILQDDNPFDVTIQKKIPKKGQVFEAGQSIIQGVRYRCN